MKLSTNQQLIITALATLGAGPSVAEVAAATGLKPAAVSANLKPLRDKGLIATPEGGKNNGLMIVLLDTEAAPQAPVIAAPTVKKLPGQVLIESIGANLKPRELVLQLIQVSGMTKKAAKRTVYDHCYC